MDRDLTRLAGAVHDVLVVGGGIQGACIAWDAALRGLRVGLIERDDFGAATSANSLRIVHGGLRYLTRGDLARMRESIRERSALLRIAPSLVEPLPVLVPTRGAGFSGRAAFRAALALNDLLSADRNRGLDPAHRLPSGRLLSTDACRRMFAAFPDAQASGGALWYDARMRHPERLTLAFVRAAAGAGANVANHVQMDRAVSEGGAVRGVEATDRIQGQRLTVRAHCVVLAAGPWTPGLAGRGETLPQAFALNRVSGRRLAECAVGVRTSTGPDADPIIGGRRYIFLVPQGETTLLGTWYAPASKNPAELAARGSAKLLAEIRAACPALELLPSDVVGCQWGWLPLKGGRERGRPDALAERPRVTEHGGSFGPTGMFSVEGVKYTTARQVAEEVVDRIVRHRGAGTVRPCRTAAVRIDEGEADAPQSLGAWVRRAVREEMAVRLSDVLRRLPEHLREWAGRPTVEQVARLAGAELAWSAIAEQREIEDVMRQTRAPGTVMESAR